MTICHFYCHLISVLPQEFTTILIVCVSSLMVRFRVRVHRINIYLKLRICVTSSLCLRAFFFEFVTLYNRLIFKGKLLLSKKNRERIDKSQP